MTQSWENYPKRGEAPDGAPNVLLVLTDDVGFGACSTFGGLIPTPCLDRLASSGLRYNAFHTTAMCSPTRAALLTGRNHHSVGYGAISNYSIDAPGYTSVLPKSAATIARILRENGFDTAMFGKNHNTPEWELGPLGPFDNWPLGMGFNYFYGFNAAQADQFKPPLTENLNALRAPNDPDYHLDKDLSDRFIQWMQMQKAVHPDRPFFAYWAPGTLHEPHQAPADWIKMFEGAFNDGWDILRERAFENQKRIGIVPEHAVLTPRPSYIPAWIDLPAPEQSLYMRQMEVAAAQLAHFDHQFGRALDALAADGHLDNTLVLFVQGDNGACQEYEYGNTNYDLYGIITETPADMIPKRDRLGGPNAHGTYHPGWGWTMNTPLPESKQIASHLGGIRNGLVVSWPKGIAACGEIREQFTHVIDVAPTILEVLGIELPTQVDGVTQQPIEGTSFAYTFADAGAATRHDEQYFEMLGNRGLFQRGWMASTLPPRPPFGDTSGLDPLTFEWALYNLNEDWSQSSDVSGDHPDRLIALKRRFDEYAERYSLLPLANDQVARMNDPTLRPSPLSGGGARAYPSSDIRYRGGSFPPLSPGWECRAELAVGDEPAAGPILSLGSRFSGVSMAMRAGRPMFVVNPTGESADQSMVSADTALDAGTHSVVVRLENGTPAKMTMTINDREVDKTSVGVFPVIMTPETYIGRVAIDEPDEPANFILNRLIVTAPAPVKKQL